ncbi:hypothetical protein SAMN05428960_1047 [Mitsuaria sp. PDC51]|uniref:HAD domain-containing protein n=1 Tax=Mitsuaria sp. PDC51 TaxID=1881035 RepID=UPI0008E67383|nr:HAD domain-containing protein [Mitsuaria sp. PDC51]SFR74966.1 hypothetical protein SAMN05428960_1047 [Mitsuaria sp. PDC51]
MAPVVFLNLDGVTHPLSMQYAVLRGYPHAGPPHFCWATPLRDVLERWDASVVFRSTAVSMFGIEAIKSLAPAWLQGRVTGATGDVVRCIALFELRKVNTVFGTIRNCVQQNKLLHWVSLDDSDDGWPSDPAVKRHLVKVDASSGLSDPKVIKRLEAALRECAP